MNNPNQAHQAALQQGLTSSTISVRDLVSPRRNAYRRFKDQLASWSISAGGMGVLVAILLIFFYLLYEIMPLFTSAEINQEQRMPTPGSRAATLMLAMEEQAEVGLRVTEDAKAAFFRVANGELMSELTLPAAGAVTAQAISAPHDHLFALGYGNGQVLVAKHHYKISYPNGRVITPVIEYPYGEALIELADAPLEQLALRVGESGLTLVGYANQQLHGLRFEAQEDFLSGEVTQVRQSLSLPSPAWTPVRLLMGPDQRWLYLLSAAGEYQVIDLRLAQVVDQGRLFEQGKLSQATLLLGGISLLAANDQGLITQHFMVNADGQAWKLQAIRQFEHDGTGLQALVPEQRRKGFLSLDQNGVLDLFYSTSARHLLSEPVAPLSASLHALAISPRGERLLIEQGDELVVWGLHNEHPEVSWQALWGEVWYESYREPDYVWQSSASNNDFEPKYSFAPLAFGTLKAAFYAMLIAAPLAICGAIYTAYFMAPALRTKIKPAIELMEALPTVILGFLAGLWLAPFVERHLPGVFAILLLLPPAIVLLAALFGRLPRRLTSKINDGWHVVLLIPVIALVVYGCISASPYLEQGLFHGDMRAWLTHELGVSFDQRNALIVGIAMGFAVIPNIFSIAEDAIFSVPKHLSHGSLALGATPWQTLVGVVLPTASPGIFSALMIGMGRAVGETMIVLMATGNTPIMDANIFEGMRTLSANIAVEIGETEVDSTHYRVLFLAAFALFLFTFVVNTVAEVVRQRLRRSYGAI